eukprot:8305196-Pyramimonas_sp.AAC.1
MNQHQQDLQQQGWEPDAPLPGEQPAVRKRASAGLHGLGLLPVDDQTAYVADVILRRPREATDSL